MEDNIVEDNLEDTLSQSSATKINAKWAVKLSYGESPVVCFIFNKLEQKKDEEDNLSAALTGFRNSIERHLNKNGVTLKISNFKSFKTAAKFTTPTSESTAALAKKMFNTNQSLKQLTLLKFEPPVP